MAGLVREAADRALADAELGWNDIDAVVIGKAPDFFEGVAMPELYLTDALAAIGKPLFRVHTAGSVGGSTTIVASQPTPARARSSVAVATLVAVRSIRLALGSVGAGPQASVRRW
jgi:acetyl-CoA C-acetyltransferase